MAIELFYWPPSFYSQTARLSLEEKGISYKPTIISLKDREQNQPWYLKLNPNGEVPTLKIGEECFIESENIIEIVDKIRDGGKLVPDPNTMQGKEVSEWRKRLYDVNVGNITYGVMIHPELSPGTALPPSLRYSGAEIRAVFEKDIKEMEETKLKNPELQESCNKKIEKYKERLVNFFDKDRAKLLLNGLDTLVDEIEQQLHKKSSGYGGEVWLCGSSFTAADIFLCVLLGRINMLGLIPRFLDPQKRPILAKYWERAKQRPSVQKVILNHFDEVKRLFIGRKLRRYGGIAAGVGVVGLAVWLAHRHFTK